MMKIQDSCRNEGLRRPQSTTEGVINGLVLKQFAEEDGCGISVDSLYDGEEARGRVSRNTH